MKYPSLFTGLNGLLNFDHEWDNFLPTPRRLSHNWEVSEEGLSIQLDVPGLTKEDLKVETVDQIITISGVKEFKNNSSVSRKQYFYRTIIPDGVEVDKIEAQLEHGVLTLSAPNPKPESSKSKSIKIK